MDKIISSCVPEDEHSVIKNLAEMEGESISGYLKKLLRREISRAELGKEEDPKIEEILGLLRGIVEAKPDQNPNKNQDPAMAKKIEDLTKILSDFPAILDNKIGQIPDVSGLKTSVGELSNALGEGEKKAKNIGGYLGQAEEKAKNILGKIIWEIAFILLISGGGFVLSGYALALHIMPDIPALLKQQAALKESIRVLEIADPKKLDMNICGGIPCVRIVPGASWSVGQDQSFYQIDPIK